LTQFPGLILRVHDSPFQSRVPLGVVNFRDGQLVCRGRPLVHASSCKASWSDRLCLPCLQFCDFGDQFCASGIGCHWRASCGIADSQK
jgi:hypothetical protein